jgi:hypothetical protein
VPLSSLYSRLKVRLVALIFATTGLDDELAPGVGRRVNWILKARAPSLRRCLNLKLFLWNWRCVLRNEDATA